MLAMNKEEESGESNYVSLPVGSNPTPRTNNANDKKILNE
jgi:hypothetical protein